MSCFWAKETLTVKLKCKSFLFALCPVDWALSEVTLFYIFVLNSFVTELYTDFWWLVIPECSCFLFFFSCAWCQRISVCVCVWVSPRDVELLDCVRLISHWTWGVLLPLLPQRWKHRYVRPHLASYDLTFRNWFDNGQTFIITERIKFELQAGLGVHPGPVGLQLCHFGSVSMSIT